MRNNWKRAGCTILLAASLVVSSSAYSDVTGDDLNMAVNSLSSMDIVNGYSDGTFKPNNYVTRAEFSKLVIEASSESVTLATTGTTSPYSDVSSSHWAAKYITLADNLGYVNGTGSGTFAPEANITLGEASTVVLRMLGYTTADIGYVWPEDYTDAANTKGILEGVSVTGDYDYVTRGDVAQMLYNMITCENSDGDDFVTTWASSCKEDVVLVEADTTTITYIYEGAVAYAGFVYDIPEDLYGTCRGTLLFNSSGRICGFVPNDETRITVDVAEVNSSEVEATDGTNYSVPSYATVIIGDSEYYYGNYYYTLDGYSSVTLCYGEDGIVDLVLPQSGGYVEGYQIHGYYESATPNASQPTTVTIMGATLSVDDDIAKNFGAFALGEHITVTLDALGNVIDVHAYDAANDTQLMFGVISDEEVTLSCGVVLSGDVNIASSVQDGQMVQIDPTGSGKFNVYATKFSTTSTFYVDDARLGGYPLAETCVIYECVGSGAASKITLSDIPFSTVASSKVLYHNVNSDGEIDVILLEDVTGDCYTYGMIITANDKDSTPDIMDGYDGDVKDDVDNNCFVIVNGDTITDAVDYNTFAGYSDWYFYDEYMGGVVISGNGKLQSQILLTSTGVLDRIAISGDDSLVANGVRYDIADDVQVLCGVTETWSTVESAMVLATSFEAYYDKAPEDGGKIRVIRTYAD